MITILTRTQDDVVILQLKGRLRANTEHAFWKKVRKAVVDDGARKLLLDFSDVTECDSYGIAEVLRAHESIGNIGGKMILTNLNELIRKVFALTKVDTVLRIAGDEAEALAMLLEPDMRPQ